MKTLIVLIGAAIALLIGWTYLGESAPYKSKVCKNFANKYAGKSLGFNLDGNIPTLSYDDLYNNYCIKRTLSTLPR